MLTIRPINIPKNIFKGTTPSHSQVMQARSASVPLLGRRATSSPNTPSLNRTLGDPSENLVKSRLDYQLAEESANTHTKNNIFRGHFGHREEHGGATSGEGNSINLPTRENNNSITHLGLSLPQATRIISSHNPNNKMGPLEDEDISSWILKTVEALIHSSADQIVTNNETFPQLVVTSDASAMGWGAHCNGHLAQGRWKNKKREVSNIIELRAAFQALKAFQDQIRGASVTIQMDNKAAVAYIHHQGGTQNQALLTEVSPIMNWAQQNLTNLTAVYIPAPQNYLADTLSRKMLDKNEWALNQMVFQRICNQWGQPDLDLMASPTNSKCRRFLARAKFPQAEAVDALSSEWICILAYVFPPMVINSQTTEQDMQPSKNSDSSHTYVATQTMVPITLGLGT